MASARTENFLPSQNSLLFNLAADWIMRDLAKGLEDPRFPKKLHEAFWWGNLRGALILAVGVTGVAVAKDYIDKNITVGAGSQPEPNSTNAGIPGSFTETMRVLDTPTPHPTETLTPTRLPTFTLTPTETSTPTKVFACGITQRELDSYKGGILSEGHFAGEYGHSYDMGVTFTDKYLSREVVDPVSGSVVAKLDLVCAVTRDELDNRKLVYIPFQAERLDKPGVNAKWAFTLDALHGFPIDATSYMTNPDKSLHDPAEIINGLAGKSMKISFPLDNTIGRRINADSWWISNELFLDISYGKKLKELVATKGGSIDNNAPPIIWLHGWDAWGG